MARTPNKFANSFWVGYSDLMTSLFFVFLVLATTLALAFRAQAQEGEAARKELERIRAIADVSSRLSDRDFLYNDVCNRFELKYEFEFQPGQAVIPSSAQVRLLQAGRAIDTFLRNTPKDSDVRFKIIVEGRAARYIPDNGRNADPYNQTKALSYRRALAVWDLWKANEINLNTSISEFFISGSGFEGECRYPMTLAEEGKNKRIIVQIIPFLTSGQ